MNTTELLSFAREELFDKVAPYLWSDTLLYAYIDDAQKWFCRLTYGIEDSRSFKINIKADGTEWYAIDPMILKLRDAIDPATGGDVALISVEKMGVNGMKFDGTRGALKALITGMEKNYVRAYPVPNVASVVELRTFRLPADVVAGDDFEIDAQHHLALLKWVKHKAYDVQDADARDPKKSAENEAAFMAYCAAAKVEQSRMRRPVSTVAYGGI
jgi:hypothetical protein